MGEKIINLETMVSERPGEESDSKRSKLSIMLDDAEKTNQMGI